MQQGDHDTCPGGAYRVAKTDTASVDIYNISVQIQQLFTSQVLSGKSLV